MTKETFYVAWTVHLFEFIYEQEFQLVCKFLLLTFQILCLPFSTTHCVLRGSIGWISLMGFPVFWLPFGLGK